MTAAKNRGKPVVSDLQNAYSMAEAREKLREANEARERALDAIRRAEIAQKLADAKGEGYLTLEELSKLARVPFWRARRLKQKGVIKPAINPKGGRGKMALFHFSQVDSLRGAIAQVEALELQMSESNAKRAPLVGRLQDRAVYSKEEGVKMFALFQEGKNIHHAVLEVGVHPDAAQAAWSVWSRLANGVFLTRSLLDKLYQDVGHAIAGIGDVMTGDDLAECLSKHVLTGPPKCVLCKSRPRVVCKACLIEASEPPTGKRLKAPSLIDRPHVEEGDQAEDREHEGDEHLKGHG